ncbi:hypothetical protein ACFL30_00465 [Candidatus Latescibacterota bacterium]
MLRRRHWRCAGSDAPPSMITRLESLLLTEYFHKPLSFVILVGVLVITSITSVSCTHKDSPDIDVWYGNEQSFGLPGNPQKWANILGSVSSENGIRSLAYSLNGEAVIPLSIGPDGKRLANPGDFNIDIDCHNLNVGANTVTISTTDSLYNSSESTVTVNYSHRQSWPLPYSIDWQTVNTFREAVQVVDGKWKLEADGIRIVEPYYDRVLALGDSTWTDYEVTAEVIFHGSRQPRKGIDGGASVIHAAIAMRWPGHDEDGLQPRVKWYPLGATAEFRLIEGNPDDCRWRIIGEGGKDFKVVNEENGRAIKLGKRYIMKARVETRIDSSTLYSVKFWESNTVEPENWDLQAEEGIEDVQSGGALLIAHYTNLTFGEITVNKVNDINYKQKVRQ